MSLDRLSKHLNTTSDGHIFPIFLSDCWDSNAQHLSPIKSVGYQQSTKGRKESTTAAAKIERSRPDAMKRMLPDAKVAAN